MLKRLAVLSPLLSLLLLASCINPTPAAKPRRSTPPYDAKVRDGSGHWDYRRTCVEGPVFDAEEIEF